MIDNTKAKVKLPDVTVLQKTCFTQTDTDTYTLKLFEHAPGLKVKFNPVTHTATFQNSLHKLYHAVNYNDFTLPDIVTVTDALCDIFDVYPDAFNVTGIEVGLNLHTPQPAQTYLHEITAYNSKPFYFSEPPRFTVKPLQIRCKVNEKVIKFYNKGLYERLSNTPNLLRYEIVFETSRSLQTVLTLPDVTFATLQTHDFYNTMQMFLVHTYQSCTRKPAILPPDVVNQFGKDKYNKLALLTAPPMYFDTVKGISTHTHKEHKQRFKELYNKILPYLEHTDLTPIILNKFTELVAL